MPFLINDDKLFRKYGKIRVSNTSQQKYKESPQKRLMKNNEIFQKKKQAKYLSMIVNDIEIFQKIKKQRLVEYSGYN